MTLREMGWELTKETNGRRLIANCFRNGVFSFVSEESLRGEPYFSAPPLGCNSSIVWQSRARRYRWRRTAGRCKTQDVSVQHSRAVSGPDAPRSNGLALDDE